MIPGQDLPGNTPFLSRLIYGGITTEREALSAQKIVNTIPVRLLAIDIQKALKLALEFKIYAYDAYFLQCAMALSSPLITLDNRMKKVANELNIEVLE